MIDSLTTVLSDSVAIGAPPEDAFEFFRHMDESRYLAWHPDHEGFRYVTGDEIAEGAVVFFEEYVGDRRVEVEMRYTEVVPNERIEYEPRGRLVRAYYPKGTFEFERIDGGTRFTATNVFRIGPLDVVPRVERIVSDTERHMREEGRNLKRLVEE